MPNSTMTNPKVKLFILFLMMNLVVFVVSGRYLPTRSDSDRLDKLRDLMHELYKTKESHRMEYPEYLVDDRNASDETGANERAFLKTFMGMHRRPRFGKLARTSPAYTPTLDVDAIE